MRNRAYNLVCGRGHRPLTGDREWAFPRTRLISMDELLDEMDAASRDRRFFAAVHIAMTIPDICAGLRSDNGQTSGSKYVNWFNTNMLGGYLDLPWGSGPDARPWMTGEDCWIFRNAILHQGRGDHKKASDGRIAFSSGSMHKIKVAGNLVILSAPQFVADMSDSARSWLEKTRQSEPVASNLKHSIRARKVLHHGGMSFDGGFIA
jgi:hypothetical protein